MRDGARVLDQFGVPYVMELLAIHQDPQRMVDFATSAAANQYRVIIAGGGGAAHLPGMIAAFTPLPVIGVPVKSDHSIDGLDAIYSMLQMPKGVPVATMALNNCENAALFALQVLGSSHPSYLELVQAYKHKRKEDTQQISKNLQNMGYRNYLQERLGVDSDEETVRR
jgi:phosphoribosylaminoimidazole carboxylase PurE protein